EIHRGDPPGGEPRPVVGGKVIILGEHRLLDGDDARMRVMLVFVPRVFGKDRQPGAGLVAASAVSTHSQATSSDVIRSSRPARTSTSALPHSHSSTRSVSVKS